MRYLVPLLLLATLWGTDGRAQCTDCDGDGFAPPADCDDGSVAIHPGATEVCDGVDNDCDALIDGLAGCDGTCSLSDKKGGDRRLSNLVQADSPAIVWTGSEFGVAWWEFFDGQTEIFFVHLDPNGVPLAPSVRVTFTPDYSTEPSLAWNGSGYGLTWIDGGRVMFVRLDAMGQRLGNDSPVGGSNAIGQALVWTGAGYGVAWDTMVEGSNSEIFFSRLDPMGHLIDPSLRVTNAISTSVFPDLAWTGDGFGLTWYDLRDLNPEIYFARIASNGTKLGTDVRVTNTPTPTDQSEIEWSGSEFGLVWIDQPGNPEVYFALLDPAGSPIGSPLRVTNDPALSNHPALVRTGNGHGIAWYDLRDGNAEIYFAHVTSGGVLNGGPVRVTSDLTFANHPVIAWAGQDFALAWHDLRLGLDGVYFARVGCGCVDVDGDGSTSCRDCDETRIDIHPGVPDVCDGLDQDCDGLDGVDRDLDGFSACTGDCNDGVPQFHPGAVDLCDGLDNDCSGGIDDTDRDADGFLVCQDCNDADPAVNPAAPEICDGADNDCNGLLDEDFSGQDADGDSVPGACDNCPTNANLDQTDHDADGEGDACDLNDGVILVMLPDDAQVSWQQELEIGAFNEYRGDLAVLRASGQYTQDPATVPLAARNCGLTTTSILDGPNPPVGRVLFYLVTGIRAGLETSLGTDSAGAERPNDHPCP